MPRQVSAGAILIPGVGVAVQKGRPRRIDAGAFYIGTAALTQLVSGFRTAAPFVGYPNHSQDNLPSARPPRVAPEELGSLQASPRPGPPSPAAPQGARARR